MYFFLEEFRGSTVEAVSQNSERLEELSRYDKSSKKFLLSTHFAQYTKHNLILQTQKEEFHPALDNLNTETLL